MIPPWLLTHVETVNVTINLMRQYGYIHVPSQQSYDNNYLN